MNNTLREIKGLISQLIEKDWRNEKLIEELFSLEGKEERAKFIDNLVWNRGCQDYEWRKLYIRIKFGEDFEFSVLDSQYRRNW